VIGILHIRSVHLKSQREAGYEAALRSYNSIFAPGTTRQGVEEFLDAKRIPFRRTCCDLDNKTYADETRIGTELSPWYCSENDIYIEFQFAAKPIGRPSQQSSDTLTTIAIRPKLEGCL
jgi:hypothetical protein